MNYGLPENHNNFPCQPLRNFENDLVVHRSKLYDCAGLGVVQEVFSGIIRSENAVWMLYANCCIIPAKLEHESGKVPLSTSFVDSKGACPFLERRKP